MEDRFAELRATICYNNDELRRFRQLVVNSIMATDLGDKQLKELRNGRWEKAFNADTTNSTTISSNSELPSNDFAASLKISKRVATNRKATIVVSYCSTQQLFYKEGCLAATV